MATKTGNLIYVDQLQDAIPGAFVGQKALAGTGMAIIRTDLPTMNLGGGKIKGGTRISIPYWDVIGELEDVTETQALTPRNMSESSENATVQRSGVAGEITQFAQLAAMGSDPYAELARQIAETTMRRVDKGLIDQAATSPLVNDQSSATDLISVTNGTGFLYFVKTLDLLGDEQEGVVGWVMHSKMVTALRSLVDSLGRSQFTGLATSNGSLTLYEKPIVMSDRMPVTGTGATAVYTSAAVKKNALAAWINGSPTIKADSDILTDSDLQALNVYHVEHLYKRSPDGNGSKCGVALLKCKAGL